MSNELLIDKPPIRQDFLLGSCRRFFTIENLEKQNFVDPRKPETEGPKVLTTQILSAGFYIWIMSVFCAGLVFFGEKIFFLLFNQKVRIGMKIN